MREVDLLISNGIILTQDEEDKIIYGGNIAVNNGRIEAIGPREEIEKDFTGRKVIDASRKAVMPGFVNTHFHFTQNFMKGTRDDLDLLDWIDEVSFPRIRVTIDEYRKGITRIHKLAAIHAGIDLLSSGITCSANMEWGMLPGIREAYETTGLRIMNILTLTDVDCWTPKEIIIKEDEIFSLAEELISAFSGTGDTIGFAYGIACPNSVTENLIRRVREESRKNGVPVHIHLAETKYEYDTLKKERGVTPTRYLDDLGLWDEDVWAAHSIWLDPDDIDILAERRVGVSHNPKCNMKIASGAAPIAAMKTKGIDIGIGIDSCAVSDNTDFFEAMRTMIFLQRVTTMNPKSILGRDALRMATIGGAKILGLEDRIGSLEEGKYADIQLIRLSDVNTRPYNDLINNLVFAANSSNIEQVLVGGEVLLDKGVFTRFDKSSTLDYVEAEAAAVYREQGVELPRHFAINQL